MKNKILLGLGLGALFVTGSFVFGPQSQASAASLCYVLVPAASYSNPPQRDDCLSGQQNPTALEDLQGLSGDKLKQQFTSDVQGYANSDKQPMKAGGEYIKNWMTPSGMTFAQFMSGDDVTATINPNYTFHENSGYEPSSNSVSFYAKSETVPAVIIKQDGNIIMIVKLDCGNPLDRDSSQHGQRKDPIGQFKAIQCPDSLVPGKDGVVVAAYDPDDLPLTDGSDGHAVNVRVMSGGNVILGPVLANDAVSGYANHNNHQFNGSDWANFVTNHIGDSSIQLNLYAQDKETGDWVKIDDNSTNLFDATKCSNPSKPKGQITAKCNPDGSGNATVTVISFSDSDGTTTAKAYINGTVQSPNPLAAPRSWAVPASTATTTGVDVRLDVKDVNSDGSSNGYVTVSSPGKITCPGPGGGGGDCDGQDLKWPVALPAAKLPSHPGVTVDTAAPAASKTATGKLYTTTKSAKYYQEDPGDYKVTKAEDQWAPSPTGITTTAGMPTAYQASATFTLDYTKYKTDYPYDDHQTTVTYNQRFDETYWHSSGSPDFYTCPSDETNNNDGTCTYDASSSTSCSSGQLDTDSNVNNYGSSGAEATLYNNCDAFQHSLNSADGLHCKTDYAWYGGPSGSGCYNIVGSQVTTYSCKSGDPKPNSSHKCTHTAEYDYYWHTDPTVSNVAGPDTTFSNSAKQPTANSTFLAECFQRNFEVKQPADSPGTDVTSVSFNNNENPTSVTVGTKIAVEFTLVHGGKGVHDAAQVKGLNYQATYYIAHANQTSMTFWKSDFAQFTVGQTTAVTPALPITLTSGTYSGSAQAAPSSGGLPYAPTMSIAIPPLAVGDKVCAEFTIDPESGEMDHTGARGVSNGSVSSTGIPNTPTCSAPVTNSPYTRMYGNDVLAGAMLPNGTCTGNEAIRASRNGTAGSGSQFAAISPAAIQGFASSFLRNAAANPPTVLSFANTTAGDGGAFDTVCKPPLPDYYTVDMPSNPDTTTPLTSINAASLAANSGSHTYKTGGGDLNAQDIPVGVNVAVFVTGNVRITGNIKYNPGWSYDSSTRSTNAPSFYLIVKGNIDIAPTVSNLDGVFIAQPGGGGGTIRTCTPAGGIVASNLYNDCNFQLTVNGAFIAQNVLLNRTYKSLRDGFPGENSLGGTQNAAEIFNFSPETYLNNPAIRPTGGPKLDKYDYITSLSPVL